MTGKQVCPKHKWAHLIGTECPWCVPEPLEAELPVPTFYGKDNSLGLFDIFPFGHVSYVEGDTQVGKTLFGDAMLACIADDKAVGQFSTKMPTPVIPMSVCSKPRMAVRGITDIKLTSYSAFLTYASFNASSLFNSFIVFDSDVCVDITPSKIDARNFHSNFVFLTRKVDPLDWLEASTILGLTRGYNIHGPNTTWNFSIKKSIDPSLTDFMLDYSKI